MYKRLKFILIFFFTLALTSQVIAESDFTKVVKKIQSAVVTVITYDIDKNVSGFGTGFFVDKKGHLVTNYHVLKKAYDAQVKTYDGKVYPIKLVIAENENMDIIKVSVDIPEKLVRWTIVTGDLPNVAEQLLVVGSPMGLEQTVSEGIASAVREMPGGEKFFQISAPVSPGSSGSPVVNMKGEVIGVATFQFAEGQNLNFAVSGKSVLSLKGMKTGKTIAEWAYGISKEKLDEASSQFESGVSYAELGRYKEAIEAFKEAIRIKPDHALAHHNLGYSYAKLGRNKEAIEAYKQAIRIKPDDAEAFSSLGIAYGEIGLHKKRIEAYKQAIRIKPDDAETFFSLGISYGEIGLHKKAIEAYKQAIRIKPDDALAHCILGFCYDTLGHHKKAIEAFKQAIRINPDFANPHRGLGSSYIQLGRYKEAIGALKQAIRIDPDYASSHYGLGYSYAELGRNKEAIEAYKQAIRIDPDYAEAHHNLGLRYAHLGLNKKAIDACKQAIRIKPDDVMAHYNLGVLSLFINNTGAALEQYKILKRLDKNLANKLFNLIYP